MALITCPDCKSEISDAAPSCPRCGRPAMSSLSPSGTAVKPMENWTAEPAWRIPPQTVGFGLGLGIFLLPFIFSWVTLQRGFSKTSRIIALGWLAIVIVAASKTDKSTEHSSVTTSITAPSESSPNIQTTESDGPSFPTSAATYAKVDSEVGCESKYSDDKKDDVFKTFYKDHWMTWRGEVSLAEADNASLNVDGVGTQDLRVEFADPRAGYELTKGSRITVRFLLKSAGGCFLPFGGKEAVIVEQ